MNTITEHHLGDWVRMSGTVEKVREDSRTEFREAPLPVKYEYDCTETDLSIGIIVGSRSVQSGHTIRDYYDGPTFMADIGAAKRVWLVAFNLRRKPVMCFDHQLTSEES